MAAAAAAAAAEREPMVDMEQFAGQASKATKQVMLACLLTTGQAGGASAVSGLHVAIVQQAGWSSEVVALIARHLASK